MSLQLGIDFGSWVSSKQKIIYVSYVRKVEMIEGIGSYIVFRFIECGLGLLGMYHAGATEVPTNFEIWCHMLVAGIKMII